jgi:hypothetical protein
MHPKIRTGNGEYSTEDFKGADLLTREKGEVARNEALVLATSSNNNFVLDN